VWTGHGDLLAAIIPARRACRAPSIARIRSGDIIIDIHNYGRYVIERHGLPYECAIDEVAGGTVPVTREHFADLCVRLSQALRRSEPAPQVLAWAR
jgi:hypothetical protein